MDTEAQDIGTSLDERSQVSKVGGTRPWRKIDMKIVASKNKPPRRLQEPTTFTETVGAVALVATATKHAGTKRIVIGDFLRTKGIQSASGSQVLEQVVPPEDREAENPESKMQEEDTSSPTNINPRKRFLETSLGAGIRVKTLSRFPTGRARKMAKGADDPETNEEGTDAQEISGPLADLANDLDPDRVSYRITSDPDNGDVVPISQRALYTRMEGKEIVMLSGATKAYAVQAYKDMIMKTHASARIRTQELTQLFMLHNSRGPGSGTGGQYNYTVQFPDGHREVRPVPHNHYALIRSSEKIPDATGLPRQFEEEVLLRTPNPNWGERECINGDCCQGMLLPVEHQCILREYVTPDEWATFVQTRSWPHLVDEGLGAPGPRVPQRMCLLCLRDMVTGAIGKAKASMTSMDEGCASLVPFWNLVGIGEYDKGQCEENGENYYGLFGPVVKHIANAFNTRVESLKEEDGSNETPIVRFIQRGYTRNEHDPEVLFQMGSSNSAEMSGR